MFECGSDIEEGSFQGGQEFITFKIEKIWQFFSSQIAKPRIKKPLCGEKGSNAE